MLVSLTFRWVYNKGVRVFSQTPFPKSIFFKLPSEPTVKVMLGSNLFWLIWPICISIWIIQFCLFSCLKEYKGPWYACQVACYWAIPHPYMGFRNWGQFFRKGSSSHCRETFSLFTVSVGVLSSVGFLFLSFVFFKTLGPGKQSCTELHPGFIVVLLTVLRLSIQWHRLLSHSFGLSGLFSAMSQNSQIIDFILC